MAGDAVRGWAARARMEQIARSSEGSCDEGLRGDWEALKATDPEVAEAIANELERERTTCG